LIFSENLHPEPWLIYYHLIHYRIINKRGNHDTFEIASPSHVQDQVA